MGRFYINRRNFLKSSSALLAYSSLGQYGLHLWDISAQQKVAVIGTGWYGKSDIFRLIQVSNVEVVAICDVDSKALEFAADLISQRQKSGKKPKTYKDYRVLLKEHELDIVMIGSPDHWHALQAIEALNAGAHVYLQKPISVDVLEGEAIIKAAEAKNRIVQVGTQRRSTPHLVEAKKKVIDQDLLGDIAHVELCCYYHMRFSGNPPVQSIPDHFDYDFWSGPAPVRPFDGLPHRRWRAYMEYGNGIMGDMCIHMFDTARWMLNKSWPIRISSSGGIYHDHSSNANITDTQTAIFEYEDLNMIWQHRTWGSPTDPDYPWAFKIYGENGVLKGDVWKWKFENRDGEDLEGKVVYEKDIFKEDQTEKGLELHAAPATRAHMLDFLKSIEDKTAPIANIYEGHISSASCILANVSMQLKRPLAYDQKSKSILNDPEATSKLARQYRGPWIHPINRI